MRALSKKAGSPPGSMVYIGPGRESPALIERISYDRDSLIVEQITSGEPFSGKADMINLILFHGVHDVQAVHDLAQEFGVHPLISEDIVNTMHRPKINRDDQHLFLTMKTCYTDKDASNLLLEQISFLVTGNTLVCFRENADDFSVKIKDRLARKDSRLRNSGIDYLLYVLLDYFVDNYFHVLEQLGSEQDGLQEEMLDLPAAEHLEKIFKLRRDTSALRQAIWPFREIINSFLSHDEGFMRSRSRAFFRDVHDHCLHIMDSLEMLREMNTTLHEVYLSLTSHRLNTVMKLLTIIATIFIPLTFIAGVYGMNFAYMPELAWKAGYFICLGFMAFIGLGLIGFFKYKRWF